MRPSRDREAERQAADEAFELAKRKDRDIPYGLMNGDHEVKYLPVSDDEVLSTGERLRAAEPQPVRTYRICETCGGHRSWPPNTRQLCLTCEGSGRVSVERDMTLEERILLNQVFE